MALNRINVHILYNNYIKHGLIETLKVSEQSLQDTLKNASKMQPLIDVENAVNQIVFSFIHYEQNKELLKNAVHRKWHDLAIVYNWFIDKEAGYYTQIIDDSAEKLGLSEEDLFLAAARNTMRLFPPKVENLSNYIVSHNISDEPDVFDQSDLNPMYIITNEECSNGAIVVLYENLLHELAEKLESDLYLLPSSVNEMNLAKNTEDIIMKNVFDLLKGDALKFFGIDKKIVARARTEVNFVELKTNFDDNVYLLEDGTLIHFEFQTTNKKDDIYRFMVSDAFLAFKERKSVRTIVIYSSDIVNAPSNLDLGSITYKIDTFYMVAFDGDVIYNNIVEKVSRHEKLTKQDLMSIVLLPIMRSKDDKVTRIKNCIELSKRIEDTSDLSQIQAMLYLMAEKFVNETEREKVKEMITMMPIMEMIRNDDRIALAKRMMKYNEPLFKIIEYTQLDESVVKQLQQEFESE